MGCRVMFCMARGMRDAQVTELFAPPGVSQEAVELVGAWGGAAGY